MWWTFWRWSRGLLSHYVTRRWERRIRRATGEPVELWHDMTRWAHGWSVWLSWDGNAESPRPGEVRAVGQLLRTPSYYVGSGETPRDAVADLRRQLMDDVNNREWVDEGERQRMERIATGLSKWRGIANDH